MGKDRGGELVVANERLKSGKIGVRIEQIPKDTGRLYLVATLPPKPKSDRSVPHQQRISLGIYANPAGIKQAEAEARRLGGQIATRGFNWSLYIPDEVPDKGERRIAQCLREFEEYFFEMRGKDIKSEATWRKDYRAVLTRLPQDRRISNHVLLEAIAQTEPNTRTRKKFCTVLKALAEFEQIELDTTRLRGNYSPQKVQQRILPTDKEIEETFLTIPNQSWKWVYGMLAAFGLRSHEVFFVDENLLREKGICYVTEGKTTDGKVWALHPRWLDHFGLRDICRPNVNGRLHTDYGERVSGAFQRYKIPHCPLSLRHRWSARAIEVGLDSRLTAKQMRHSHSVNTSTYNLWLDDGIMEREFQRIRDQEP